MTRLLATWLLDTNVCIRYLNKRSPAVRQKLGSVAPSQICVASVVKAELYFGAARSKDPTATRSKQDFFLSRFHSLAFDDDAADAYAVIRADLTERGMLIGPNDLLIAAVCVAIDLTLVTHNVAEFQRVTNLRIEDWET